MSEPEIPHIIAGPAAILARRYASALYDAAESSKQLDAVIADMRKLRELLENNAEFKIFAANPRLTRHQLVEIVKKVAEAAKVGRIAETFLEVLGQNRRLTSLQDIIAVFLYEVHKRHGEQTAEVFAASAMSQEQQSSLAANLGKLTGSKVNVIVQEDKDLLGGFIAKVGSKLIDASLKGKLARIERELKSHSTAKAA